MRSPTHLVGLPAWCQRDDETPIVPLFVFLNLSGRVSGSFTPLTPVLFTDSNRTESSTDSAVVQFYCRCSTLLFVVMYRCVLLLQLGVWSAINLCVWWYLASPHRRNLRRSPSIDILTQQSHTALQSGRWQKNVFLATSTLLLYLQLHHRCREVRLSDKSTRCSVS